MKLVLLGIQGSGKSTQGNLLSKQLNIPYLSTGHILREIAKEKTRLGRHIKETINSGILVPDDKMIPILEQYLKRSEYKKGYILDGFPRTLHQAKEFTNNVDKIIFLDIPDKESIYRLVYQNNDARQDKTLPAIKKRIDSFHKFTEPVLHYFEKQGKLAIIDGTESIQEVNKKILRSLGKQLIKNQIAEWERKQKAIVAIVGLAGSGKTEASEYFRSKGLPVVAFGKIINEYVDEHKLKHVEDIHQIVREDIRKKYGMAAMAILNEKKIKTALEKNQIVVIDGLYSWEEYMYLNNKFSNVHIYLLAIYADKNIRYTRASKRRYRAELYGEKRDINELIGTNKGPAIAFADFHVKNNFSVDEFHDKLDAVYRTIYFT